MHTHTHTHSRTHMPACTPRPQQGCITMPVPAWPGSGPVRPAQPSAQPGTPCAPSSPETRLGSCRLPPRHEHVAWLCSSSTQPAQHRNRHTPGGAYLLTFCKFKELKFSLRMSRNRGPPLSPPTLRPPSPSPGRAAMTPMEMQPRRVPSAPSQTQHLGRAVTWP